MFDAATRGPLTRLKQALDARAPRELGALPQGVARASVLLPLFTRAGVPHLLFLKRPDGDYPHAGQIAFPGGKRDAGESALACALREAQEEVGIEPAEVELLGQLDEYDTFVTGFRINPFVGFLGELPGPYARALHQREVERVIEVPVAALLVPGCHRLEHGCHAGRAYAINYFTVGPDLIWGVTGGILAPFLELLCEAGLAARPTFAPGSAF